MFGLIIAFKKIDYSKGIFGGDWVGLDNFKFFFESMYAFRVTRNTILLNFLFIIIGTLCAIVFALLLYELSRRQVKTFQTILFIPYFLSWVVVGYVSFAMLNPSYGVINQFLNAIGMQPIEWYSEPKFWPWILLFSYLWKNIGYTSIIYYTGLMSIEPSYYEAAAIDGASKIKQMTYVSIPLLIPLIAILTLLNIGRIFYSDFGLFYFIPRDSGMLYSAVDVIDTYVYRALRVTGDIGMASAVGLFQSVVGFVMVMVSNKIVKVIDEDSAIF
jgi:ABC-type polysaccharide transport system, permease component